MALYGAQLEYALHTLVNLCLATPGEPPSARDLAEFQRLPLAFVRKLMTQLEKAGLVRAVEGVRGGWQLAVPADTLTVLQVADAVQGREPLFVCRDVRARCALWPEEEVPAAARRGVCSIHAVMQRGEQAMRDELAAHSLADLAGRVRQKVSAESRGAIVAWFGERVASRAPAARGDARARRGVAKGAGGSGAHR